MVTTVTTTTTTTTVVAANFASVAGVVAVVALIVFLVTKELLSAARSEAIMSGADSHFAARAKLLSDKANIVIFSLLFVFAAIVISRVFEVLE